MTGMSPRLALILAFLVAGPAEAQARAGVSLAGIGHDVGGIAARVIIVEFADFGCSYCAKFNVETYPKIHEQYIQKGSVRMKMVPFVTGMFRNSREVAEASECAAEQGEFKRMHDLLYLKRKEWIASRNINATVAGYAKELGLNTMLFARCVVKPEIRRRIQQHDALAQQLGINGTPTFFVNGRRVPGAIPFDVFQRVIGEAMIAR
jgi:protein-disulfide isomerase